ncbi:unnamed protein product [Coffea canephora]|uniref:Uncharacterized protein n=1 Tax=Coffea canephora TaxID=49390 RepID=A0A068U8K4_COFCA|nr:unnamed protein product [Coffea canephora]
MSVKNQQICTQSKVTTSPKNYQKRRNSIPVIIYSMHIQKLRPISTKTTLDEAAAVPFQTPGKN